MHLLPRRTLLESTALLMATARPGMPRLAAAAPRTPSLRLGLASYSLRMLSVDKVIEGCQQADIHFISLKDVHLPIGASAEDLKVERAKFDAAGIAVQSGGVIDFGTDEADIRKKFEYARLARLPLIVGAPSPGALDFVEKMVKEFNIAVAIHNETNSPFPDPRDALALIKKRDRRLGICLDNGNAARAGVDPVRRAEECRDRLLHVHIKDMNDPRGSHTATVIGGGSLDIVGLLSVLHKQRFAGLVALEYEPSTDNPLPGVMRSFAYLQGVTATLSRPIHKI